MSLSELVAKGQLINERVALTGDGGCCIIESLVRNTNHLYSCLRGRRGAFVCVSSKLHSLVTTCHITAQLSQLVTSRRNCHNLSRNGPALFNWVVSPDLCRAQSHWLQKRSKMLSQHTSSTSLCYFSLFSGR